MLDLLSVLSYVSLTLPQYALRVVLDSLRSIAFLYDVSPLSPLSPLRAFIHSYDLFGWIYIHNVCTLTCTLV